MKYRIFSVQEANDLLLMLEPVIKDLTEKKSTMMHMHEQLLTHELLDGTPEGYYETEDGKAYLHEASALEELIVSFEDGIKTITANGCVLRDIERGIVDFYHVHDSELVFLNWILGESSVNYWYEIDASYQNRRPLSELYDEE